MKSLLIVLLSIVTGAQTVASQRAYALLSGWVYPDNDIAYWTGPFSGCAAQCDATSGCIAYVPDKPKGANCWLKHQLTSIRYNSSLDTYYTTNQAAFKIRLAAKDEWRANIAGASFNSMNFTEPTVLNGKPIDYPQQWTQSLPPGIFVIGVEVKNHNYTEGRFPASSGFMAAVSYNEQLIASSVTGTSESQWFVSTTLPAAGWDSNPYFVQDNTWLSSSQMGLCASSIKPTSIFNTPYQSYIGSIVPNVTASPGWVSAPGCNAQILYFRLVVNTSSIFVPVPKNGTEEAFLSSPWLGHLYINTCYLGSYVIGSPTASATVRPIRIRVMGDDKWEFYVGNNNASITSARASSYLGNNVRGGCWRMTDVEIYLSELLPPTFLLSFHVFNYGGPRHLIYAIKYGDLLLTTSNNGSSQSQNRMTTNQSLIASGWTGPSYNDSNWSSMSLASVCDPVLATIWGNMQQVASLFAGTRAEYIWWSGCNGNGVDEDFYARVYLNLTQFSNSTEFITSSLSISATTTTSTSAGPVKTIDTTKTNNPTKTIDLNINNTDGSELLDKSTILIIGLVSAIVLIALIITVIFHHRRRHAAGKKAMSLSFSNMLQRPSPGLASGGFYGNRISTPPMSPASSRILSLQPAFNQRFSMQTNIGTSQPIYSPGAYEIGLYSTV